MKSALVRMSLAACVVFGTAGSALAAGDGHGHGGDAAALKALQLDAGKKWATDEPLRKGMSGIHTAIAAEKDAIHAGKITRERYVALGNTVEKQVAYMVQNCKLPPDADAQLHLILAELLNGAAAMQGKEKGVDPRGGVERVVAALDAYGKHFDHAGWKPLE